MKLFVKLNGRRVEVTQEEEIQFRRGELQNFEDLFAARDAKLPNFGQATAVAGGEALREIGAGTKEFLGFGGPPELGGLKGPGSPGAGAKVALGLMGLLGAPFRGVGAQATKTSRPIIRRGEAPPTTLEPSRKVGFLKMVARH